ncbi:Protein of unknown function [Gryllus bimaculatus]|nr:Protein of unknown function [Gryllus bimaculatus]
MFGNFISWMIVATWVIMHQPQVETRSLLFSDMPADALERLPFAVTNRRPERSVLWKPLEASPKWCGRYLKSYNSMSSFYCL